MLEGHKEERGEKIADFCRKENVSENSVGLKSKL